MPVDPGANPDLGTTPVIAQKLIPAKDYDPFAVIRNNRLSVETATWEATLFVNDTSAHGVPNSAGTPWPNLTVFRGILALENTVVAALTTTTLTSFASGMKIPAGATIWGSFTSITLTSGSVLMIG
jgi:hypothetical protein